MSRPVTYIALAAFLIALVASAGLVASSADPAARAGATGPGQHAAPPTTPAAIGVELQDAFGRVYDRVSPSVVQIETAAGLGSGIVFDRRGDIVTNDHVVGNSKTFVVTTSAGSGRQLTGTLVGVFAPDDLAVIRVKDASLRPARFANSSAVHVGDIAMAIGNPLGLSSSFTEGIVSALGRSEPEGNGVTLPSAIQTSAPINPGNSGGALVNIRGGVIGIPTLAALDPELGGAAAGIGFAIPSNTAVSIAHQLIGHGRVTNSHRAYLGVDVADTADAAGAYVTKVLPGTAAANAGIHPGDLIHAVKGMPTPTAAALGAVLAGLKPGETVNVEIARGAKTRQIRVTLGRYPGSG
jgi:S1-C subfamily serine protease